VIDDGPAGIDAFPLSVVELVHPILRGRRGGERVVEFAVGARPKREHVVHAQRPRNVEPAPADDVVVKGVGPWITRSTV